MMQYLVKPRDNFTFFTLSPGKYWYSSLKYATSFTSIHVQLSEHMTQYALDSELSYKPKGTPWGVSWDTVLEPLTYVKTWFNSSDMVWLGLVIGPQSSPVCYGTPWTGGHSTQNCCLYSMQPSTHTIIKTLVSISTWTSCLSMGTALIVFYLHICQSELVKNA